MLKKCPECSGTVSDQASFCPHCGFPLTKQARRTNKRMRLPNGFGQISEIKNANLRCPFRVMVSVGKDEFGRPISKMLRPRAYFKTYNEAYAALTEYHRNPIDLGKDMTFQDLYEEWYEYYSKELGSEKSMGSHSAAWQYAGSLYNKKISTIRTRDLRLCLEHASKNLKGEEKEASANTKRDLKVTFNLMFDYAVENELTDKNYARLLTMPKSVSKNIGKVDKEHIPFTDEEKAILWQNINHDYVNAILVQILTGFRPGELITLKLENINLTDWSIVGGMKTEAGTNRLVPIHPAIRNMVKEQYNLAKEAKVNTLFFDLEKKKSMNIHKYRRVFLEALHDLNITQEHRPHDPRKDFITEAKKYNLDEYAIKRIVGHKIDDITEKVYTQRGLDWLHSEMAKIKIECL